MNVLELYFNPACSKCRQARALLDERGVNYEIREYLAQAPTRAELERLAALVAGGAQSLLRSKEAAAADLEDASEDVILDRIAADSSLLERPIAVLAERAIVARPPESILSFLTAGT